MTTIRVVNHYHIQEDNPKKGVLRFPIYRGTRLGNPFVMKDRSQKERDRVCNLYEKWLSTKLEDQVRWGNGPQLEYLKQILEALNSSTCETLELVCFCSPKRCHGDTVAKTLREMAIVQGEAEK